MCEWKSPISRFEHVVNNGLLLCSGEFLLGRIEFGHRDGTLVLSAEGDMAHLILQGHIAKATPTTRFRSFMHIGLYSKIHAKISILLSLPGLECCRIGSAHSGGGIGEWD